MTEEEKKAIEDYKRVIAMYFKYSDYDLFCSNLMKSGVKGTIQNTMADMVNLIEKLQKENEELRVQGSIVYLDYKILKDKIRELLKNYEEEAEKVKISYGTGGIYRDIIDTINDLKELLEEE